MEQILRVDASRVLLRFLWWPYDCGVSVCVHGKSRVFYGTRAATSHLNRTINHDSISAIYHPVAIPFCVPYSAQTPKTTRKKYCDMNAQRRAFLCAVMWQRKQSLLKRRLRLALRSANQRAALPIQQHTNLLFWKMWTCYTTIQLK